jgi:hypothetical protein
MPLVRTLCRLEGDLRLADGTVVYEVEPGTLIRVNQDNAESLVGSRKAVVAEAAVVLADVPKAQEVADEPTVEDCG